MATTVKANSAEDFMRQGANYRLGLYRALIGRLDDAIEEIAEVNKFANSSPYDRDLPNNLPGKVQAAISNAKIAREALTKELAELEQILLQ